MTDKLLKVPPQALEIEQNVLGAIMLEQTAFERVSEFLKAEMFYANGHQEVYRVMTRLAAKNMPIDLMTVVDGMKQAGTLDQAGGVLELMKLTNGVTSSAAIETHGRIIQQKWIRREIGRKAGELTTAAYDDTVDALDLLESAEKAFGEVSGETYRSSVSGLDRVIHDTVSKIEENKSRDTAITGVRSGFRELDRCTRGWQDEDLIIIAARPSVGKTAFALNLAINAAKSDAGVLMFSLEMSKTSQGFRILSAESRTSLMRLQTGKLTDIELHDMYSVPVKNLLTLPVFLDDNPDLSITRLRSIARRLVRKSGVKLIVIDYLQLMIGEGKTSSREQEISKISRGLKNLAKELKVPIIALSQLSRDVEKRKDNTPMLADLRESGAIEQDADLVLFLYGESEEARKQDASLEGIRHIRIAKHRNGTLLDTKLDFDASIQLFTDPAPGWVKVEKSEQGGLPF